MNDTVSNIIYWLKKFFLTGDKFRFLDLQVQLCVRGDMFDIELYGAVRVDYNAYT